MEGWIKLHRKTIDSRVFANDGLLKVWVWCLLKANHKKKWVDIKTGKGSTEVEVLPGQFIFGRNIAGKELKMKPSTVNDRMKKLEKMENIVMQPNTHYSLISIVNWVGYQKKDDEDQQPTQQPTNNQPTGKQQPSDTNKNEENENNEKNVKKKEIDLEFENFWNLYKKKSDHKKCLAKWKLLNQSEKDSIFQCVSSYVKSTPDPQFRKNPLTWLNGKCWNDEIIYNLNPAEKRLQSNIETSKEWINGQQR